MSVPHANHNPRGQRETRSGMQRRTATPRALADAVADLLEHEETARTRGHTWLATLCGIKAIEATTQLAWIARAQVMNHQQLTSSRRRNDASNQ